MGEKYLNSIDAVFDLNRMALHWYRNGVLVQHKAAGTAFRSACYATYFVR